MSAPSDRPVRLRVDPVACDGVGICLHLAPDLVRADSWGFPVVSDAAVTRRRAAEAAVTGCPRKALYLEEI